MRNISKPVTRKDHDAKITGKEKYTDDINYAEDGRPFLIGRLVRADIAHGEIVSVTVPELPEGYYFVSAKDAPRNVSYYPLNASDLFHSEEEREQVLNGTPLFADKIVEYAGQPVALIVGPDAERVKKLADDCVIEYKPLPAVIQLKDAKESILQFYREYGDCELAFEQADFIYEETFTTGRQYQAYIEPQSMAAEPLSDGRIFIHGSLQCPFAVQESVCYTMMCGTDKIIVRQNPTGGAFGGKEDFPSFLGPQAAVAAAAAGYPVKIILDRREDLQFTYKRHASITTVRAAVKNGMITGMDIDGKLDIGAFLGSSVDVVGRYFCTFPGVFSIPNLRVRADAMKTNTPPNGAFRGFGVPQASFSMDMVMCHIADKIGADDLEFRVKHFSEKGALTNTAGEYYFHVPLPEMLAMAEKATDYSIKHAKYAADGVKGPAAAGAGGAGAAAGAGGAGALSGAGGAGAPSGAGGAGAPSDAADSENLRPGIGIAFGNHGAPLMGNIEWEVVKPRVQLLKHADGRVDIYTSQTEIGQGIRTAFSKIAAETLGIPYNQVNTPYPDSKYTLNTGITAASRSVVCIGKAIEEAAAELKKQWIEGEEQLVEYQYRKPAHALEFDRINYKGNQYDSYSWSAVVVEVLVNILTGQVKITNAHGVYNCGTPVDENILKGQMEGGLLQALGYGSTEKLVFGENGKIFNTAFADYHMPTAMDLPNVSVELELSEYPGGPFGAMSAGELPMDAGAAAYTRAVEQALSGICDVKASSIPFGAEEVISAISSK